MRIYKGCVCRKQKFPVRDLGSQQEGREHWKQLSKVVKYLLGQDGEYHGPGPVVTGAP